ncbi:PLP-dependent aminotransferase family protein [Enterobacteriaceae bacterium 89]|nr:PLP-dependent aminotransferase family protein [Enterobacteriaceae bacterium 89]
MNIPDDAFYRLLSKALRERSGETLTRVLYRALRQAILDGRLQAHSRLPGSRTLAQELSLSRNTVNAVLDQLTTEGYLLRDRQGSRVASLPSAAAEEPTEAEFRLPARLKALPTGTRRDSPAFAFTPGTPAVNYFPLPLWRRLIDRVLREEGHALLGYGESAGERPLREAIARHLALSRGIHCEAGQVIITEGALEGLNLCTQLLSESGQLAWLEDPGYAGARSAFVARGLQIEGMEIDEEGMQFADHTARSPRLIFTSPSHQFPLGSLMSAARRLALLQFAHSTGAWIIEDDYDSEFRYSSEPIPAMLGMQPDAPVVYLGTFSKTLFPSLRIGFVVMPKALAKAMQPAIHSLLRGGHRTEQLALAHFIEEGHYARHLASMRRLYRKRQGQLRDALKQELTHPHTVSGGEGGMHLTVHLEGIDDSWVAQAARQYQLAPAALSRYYLDPASGKTGLVLGYGNTSASRFASAIRTLNKLITQALSQSGQG